jgi:hypothetical protein
MKNIPTDSPNSALGTRYNNNERSGLQRKNGKRLDFRRLHCGRVDFNRGTCTIRAADARREFATHRHA